jgi:hypothetical protein
MQVGYDDERALATALFFFTIEASSCNSAKYRETARDYALNTCVRPGRNIR